MSSWRPPHRRSWLDLTPLIDVVFTLLLFVVVTAQFTAEDSLDLKLPVSGVSSSTPVPPAVVALSRAGELSVDGSPVSQDQLGARVRAIVGKGSRVQLRADAEVPYAKVFELIAALGEAGIRDVGLAYGTGP